jgi:hypothetical protein
LLAVDVDESILDPETFSGRHWDLTIQSPPKARPSGSSETQPHCGGKRLNKVLATLIGEGSVEYFQIAKNKHPEEGYRAAGK